MDNRNDVYRTQKIFRLLLQSMAYVGRNVRIPEEMVSSYPNSRISPAMMEILKTLLDGGMGFFCGTGDEKTVREIQIQTSAHRAEAAAADFLVIPADVPEDAAQWVEQAKTGTIYDPQRSATVLIECRSVRKGTAYRCTGPGIAGAADIAVCCSWGWEEIRRKKNRGFPLGIDSIFVDQEGNILSLPRTTKVEAKAEKEAF